MSHVRSSCFALAALGCGLCVAAVSVRPAEINETRTVTLIKKPNFFTSDSARLEVKLNVEGPELKGATKWGRLKIAEAVDDVGTDLRPKPDASGFGRTGDELDEISQFGLSKEQKEAGAFEAAIAVTVPARRATTIKSLKGEFQVMVGGEQKVASFTKLKSMQGKPLEDPVLKAAGIAVRLEPPKGEAATLAVEYTGAFDAIKEVEVVDADGKRVNSGHFGINVGEKRSLRYTLNNPLDDAMTLKISVVVGQRAVTVPFELKDIKLP